MDQTTADVRRDIEMTRERMSDTLSQLEQKLNIMQIVRDNPWPAIALAVGAGFALSGSRADVKAAAATVRATGGASNKLAEVFDDLAASAIASVAGAVQGHVDGLVDQLKQAVGAPVVPSGTHPFSPAPRSTRSAGVSRTGEASDASRAQSAVTRPGHQLLGTDSGARQQSEQFIGTDPGAQARGSVGAANVEG
ncbi:MAG: DUF3618 domain-containing protein [Anaerolineae bacterium]|nr:DUF3618 domain-containing protein [Gemmatimonadaceae bacterium]